jgi:HEAT repeat protein
MSFNAGSLHVLPIAGWFDGIFNWINGVINWIVQLLLPVWEWILKVLDPVIQAISGQLDAWHVLPWFSAPDKLTIALWFGIGVCVFAAYIFLTVYFLHLMTMGQENQAEKVKNTWTPILKQCERGIPNNLPPLRRGDMLGFLDTWIRMLDTTLHTSEYGNNMKQVAIQAGVMNHLGSMARHSNIRERLLAICAMGYLEMQDAWDWLCRLLTSKNKFLSLAAAEALVRIHPESAVKMVIPYFVHRDDWPRTFVAKLLFEAGETNVTGPLMEVFQQNVSAEAYPRLIEMMGFANKGTIRPIIRQILEQAQDERVILPCLSVLGEVGTNMDVDVVKNFTQHPNWAVRVKATNALKTISSENETDLLLQLLCDSSWWVRYRAAQVLVQVFANQPDKLTSLANSVQDPYGRDMLHQVMDEQQMSVGGELT